MADRPLKSLKLITCDNPKCKSGERGNPKQFLPSRTWTRFCCPDCRMEAWKIKQYASGPALVRRVDNLETRVKKLEREGRRPSSG